MWEAHAGSEIITRDFNTEMFEMKGFIESDEQARVLLGEYLRHNLSTAAHLIGGVDLYPVQHIAINAMFRKDFFLGIWGRGFSKTFTTAIFCFLYGIFNQGVKIGIISKSFRQSRMIFKQIEDFASTPGGVLLQQCFGKVDHKNDAWEMNIGESKVIALPLGDGSKLRGWRFNCVVIDELLLMPENVIQEVIKPFLAVQFQGRERTKVRAQEDDLIARGLMKEHERKVYLNNKLIGLSSASYKFEHLYNIFSSYENMIFGQKDSHGGYVKGKEPKSQYGIMQLSYEAAPPGLYNENSLQEALETMSEAQFAREYRAQFTDDSSGYFSMKKMLLCDIPLGESPTIELKGDASAKYIVSVDPNFDDSEMSDHFAITLLKEMPDGRLVVVHQYAVAKSGLKDRIVYMHYILTHFNVVYIILDHAGGQQFLDALNNSELFKQEKIELSCFEAEFENEENHAEVLQKAKNSYNLEAKRICHVQYFAPVWIRRANEILQAAFDHKRIWFASPGAQHLESLSQVDIPIDKLIFDPENDAKDRVVKMIDFIEHQDHLIKLVKDECALIVISTTSTGHQTFDMPQNLRRIKRPDKPRKDSYSALLMGLWAYRCYREMMDDKTKPVRNTFIPRLL